MDIYKHSCNFSFLIREILFSLSDLVSYKRWYQDIEDGLKLQESPDFSMSINKLGLLFELLTVNIARPDDSREDSDKSIEG